MGRTTVDNSSIIQYSDSMPSYLTPEELAQQLKIEVQEVMSLIDQGTLPAIRIGANIRIRRS